jgi:hypothetical protein
MPAAVKFLIGLAAVLLLGWLHHGPLGNGAKLLDRLEREGRTAVEAAELPGIEVRMQRDPLSRTAILSGPANDFQREGMGEFPGINDRVDGVEGIEARRWADRPQRSATLPLLAETLLGAVGSYLIGFALGWLLFGRRRRQSYLD